MKKRTIFYLLVVIGTLLHMEAQEIRTVKADLLGNGSQQELSFSLGNNGNSGFYGFSLTSNGYKKSIFNRKDISDYSDPDDFFVGGVSAYSQADFIVGGLVAVIRQKTRALLWLTRDSAMGPGGTLLFSWDGKELKEVLNMALSVQGVETIRNTKYLYGFSSVGEAWGKEGFILSSFRPTTYINLSTCAVDKAMMREKVQESGYKTIEDGAVDPDNATRLRIDGDDAFYLISNEFEESLMARDWSIISIKRLSPQHFEKYTDSELRLMRNEIFAYAGYRFNSSDLQEHFSRYSWYRETGRSMSSILESLNSIERHNIAVIQEVEKKRKAKNN